MGAKLSGLGRALYDPKKKQFLGRDGAAWGKLGVFYFFFYLGLAGFFCAMLAVFMALSPRDRPRYYSHASSMRTRSNPLSPGLGFRPQPDVDRNIIHVTKSALASRANAAPYGSNPRPDGETGEGQQENLYVKSLQQYLKAYYGEEAPVQQKQSDNDGSDEQGGAVSPPRNYLASKSPRFQIDAPGDCVESNNFGYTSGKPCVLVKMNKIVSFIPKPGAQPEEGDTYRKQCDPQADSIPVHCYGENPADVDNIGPLTYYSEKGRNDRCGSLSLNRFPYSGKYNREDRYQAPYVWVQFKAPKPNVLINVICRIYGQNIHFDKRTGRGLTRFQIFVEDTLTKGTSNVVDL